MTSFMCSDCLILIASILMSGQSSLLSHWVNGWPGVVEQCNVGWYSRQYLIALYLTSSHHQGRHVTDKIWCLRWVYGVCLARKWHHFNWVWLTTSSCELIKCPYFQCGVLVSDGISEEILLQGKKVFLKQDVLIPGVLISGE